MLNLPSNGPGRITLTEEQLAENLAGRPEDQVEALQWLREHCIARQYTWDQIAERIRKPNGGAYSRDSIYQAMMGVRAKDVSLDSLCSAVIRYREIVTLPLPEDGFVETRMSRTIETYLDRCKKQRRIGFIIGENACGKTTAITQASRKDPRITVVRVPEGGPLSGLLPEMARLRGYGYRQTIRDLSTRMVAEFDADDLIIWDEGDECFRAKSSTICGKTLGFMRRLKDRSGGGQCFVMDPAGYKRLQGVTNDDPLRRIYSRRMAPLFLPKFYREDLDLFAQRYGFEPAPNSPLTVRFKPDGSDKELSHTDNPQRVQDSVCGSHKDGLFVWLGLLKEASENARAANKAPTWGWVLKAHALFMAMETEVAE